MDRAPFVIMITRPSFLAEWRRTAIGAVLAMAALTVMLGFFLHSLALDRRRRELVRQRRAQAEKLEALGQLTGGMAHDFGNLLQVASANLELIALRPLDAERVPMALASAQRALERGARLVDRLLDFAKRRPMSVRSIDLGRFLADGKDLLAQAAGPGIEIRTDIAGPLPAVLADEAQLEVALLNLVVNARDAMGGRGTIRLHAYACTDDDPAPVGGDKGAVCLSVCDHGPGMSEEVLRRAAEPFFTTKGELGTGLGLAQVYGCMRQMGGNMRIESKPGEGTTVHLYLATGAVPHGMERVQVRSGPLLARCTRCDGGEFTRPQASGALGPRSIVRCTRCGEELPYGELNVRVTNEAAATSASWVMRWRRHFGAGQSAARRASRSQSHLGGEGR
jgi:signal transduction histidine kinase